MGARSLLEELLMPWTDSNMAGALEDRPSADIWVPTAPPVGVGSQPGSLIPQQGRGEDWGVWPQ